MNAITEPIEVPFDTAPAYHELCKVFQRIDRFKHLSAIAGWDYAAMMPKKGGQARAAALAELSVYINSLLKTPALKDQLAKAEQEPLAPHQRANLVEMRRQWELANLLPDSLIEQETVLGSKCEHAWRTQRPANDWKGFLENFKPVVKLARQRATILSQAWSKPAYDSLMEQFEPGMTSQEVTRIFSDLKSWLPQLIQDALARQQRLDAQQPILTPQGPFAIEAQRSLGLAVMKTLGFDFDGGRLDVSTHPFCGGVPEDVRITTRYREDDFMQSMMGVVHETGHARYEQNLPRNWLGQPVGRARSMGIHESQSLSFEMQIGCNPAFLSYITPMIRQHLGDQPAFTAENLGRLYTRIQPGFIRVEADELCYPLHVILRFEIESALINGDIEPEDIPELWDQKMQAYLGIDTRGNYKDGCLQDIHWTDGSFGYFPSYTLGAMYAAQYFATIRKQHPDLDQQIARGELGAIFRWLEDHIWQQASRYDTQELVRRATGEGLNPIHYQRHLRQRYLGI